MFILKHRPSEKYYRLWWRDFGGNDSRRGRHTLGHAPEPPRPGCSQAKWINLPLPSLSRLIGCWTTAAKIMLLILRRSSLQLPSFRYLYINVNTLPVVSTNANNKTWASPSCLDQLCVFSYAAAPKGAVFRGRLAKLWNSANNFLITSSKKIW